MCWKGALLWGMILPTGALAFAWPTWGCSLAMLAGLYGLRIIRIRRRFVSQGGEPKDATLWAVHCVASAAAYSWGLLSWACRRLRGRDVPLVEYHPPPTTTPSTPSTP